MANEIEDPAFEATGEAVPVEEGEKKSSVGGGKEEVVDEENVAAVEENQRLHKMGLNTAIAIGLHNFPEGECKVINALILPSAVRKL